ncbi:alanine racemase [Halomonas sp. HK25]|uniref:alanine racemase n=1 Tax=Halomonas sp. HK25 TaxID=3394321 RepID=UPI0039FD0896
MRIRAEMVLEHAFLESISREVGGAFYVFDEATFRGNYLSLRDRLRRHWPGTEVAYALKANYMPAIVHSLATMQGWAEVVSRFEYEVARQALPGESIIFNGPVKRTSDLRSAFEAGSQVNLDSFVEIDSLRQLAGEFSRLRVGLRIGFPSSRLSSRFGFEVGAELERALAQLAAISGVELVSLHCHATCRSLGIEDPVNRVRQLCELSRSLLPHHPIETINIGGGLLGEMPTFLTAQFPFPVPTLNAYADAIGEAFLRYRPSAVTRLVVEPGVSMVGNSMRLVARVIEVRQRREGWQALLDTSINSVNPTRSTVQPVMHAVVARPENRTRLRQFRLVGHTCMEHDVIDEALQADLEEGDFIVVENRGAYSLNYTPPFIVPAPAVVDRQGRVLKWADSSEQVLASYCRTFADSPEGHHHEHSLDLCGKA